MRGGGAAVRGGATHGVDGIACRNLSNLYVPRLPQAAGVRWCEVARGMGQCEAWGWQCGTAFGAWRNVYLHEELWFSGMVSCIFLQMLELHSCPKKRMKNVCPEIVEISTFNFFTFSCDCWNSRETSVKHSKIHENGAFF